MKECSTCNRNRKQITYSWGRLGNKASCEWCLTKEEWGITEKVTMKKAIEMVAKTNCDEEKLVYIVTRLSDTKFDSVLRKLRYYPLK